MPFTVSRSQSRALSTGRHLIESSDHKSSRDRNDILSSIKCTAVQVVHNKYNFQQMITETNREKMSETYRGRMTCPLFAFIENSLVSGF